MTTIIVGAKDHHFLSIVARKCDLQSPRIGSTPLAEWKNVTDDLILKSFEDKTLLIHYGMLSFRSDG